MYRIRHYSSVSHPDSFSVGALGFSIRVLNYIRWKLEVFIQYLVVRYLCKQGAVSGEQTELLLAKFRVDAREEAVDKLRTSPDLFPSLPSPAFPRADRYAAGSARSMLDQAQEQVTGMPPRPEPIDELAARYGHTHRAKRYARGRSKFMVGEDAEDFEKVS